MSNVALVAAAPVRSIVPVLARPAAVTVVALARPVLPISNVALLVSVPPIVRTLPPPPKPVSISTKSVLPKAPVTFSVAAAVPLASSIVPALATEAAVTVVALLRLELPISIVSKLLLVRAPPIVRLLPPVPELSTLEEAAVGKSNRGRQRRAVFEAERAGVAGEPGQRAVGGQRGAQRHQRQRRRSATDRRRCRSR